MNREQIGEVSLPISPTVKLTEEQKATNVPEEDGIILRDDRILWENKDFKTAFMLEGIIFLIKHFVFFDNIITHQPCPLPSKNKLCQVLFCWQRA